MKRQATKEEQIIVLKECHYNMERAKRIFEALQRARNQGPRSAIYSQIGKSKGNTHSGLDDTIARIDEIEREYTAQIALYLDQVNTVMDIIDRVEDYWEKVIISKRYIEGLSYKRIAKELCISKTNSIRLSKSGLEKAGIKQGEIGRLKSQ